VTFFGLTLAGCASAIEERALTTPQMQRYNRVTHALVAPCCRREAIAIHRSAEALQMLEEVKQLVGDGRSEEEIKAIYVARYGVRILAVPPGKRRPAALRDSGCAVLLFGFPRDSSLAFACRSQCRTDATGAIGVDGTCPNGVCRRMEIGMPHVRVALIDLELGEAGTVDHISLPSADQQFLMRVGFVPGAEVRFSRRAPMGRRIFS
jgi:cytochrome c-type biogenesis protein CcmH/NrfF